MKRAMISIHVFVSVPDETLAGALAKDIREAAEHATREYYCEPIKSGLSLEDETDYQRSVREKAQFADLGLDARRV